MLVAFNVCIKGLGCMNMGRFFFAVNNFNYYQESQFAQYAFGGVPGSLSVLIGRNHSCTSIHVVWMVLIYAWV